MEPLAARSASPIARPAPRQIRGAAHGWHPDRLPRRPLHVNPREKFPAVRIKHTEEDIPISEMRRQYDEDFKKNAVKLSYASSKSITQVAKDLGISTGMLSRWRQKYTPEGDKTRYATLEEENKVLRLKNAEMAMEIDMLKKASTYFASLHK